MNAPRANYVDYGGSTISQVSEADGYQLSDGSATVVTLKAVAPGCMLVR